MFILFIICCIFLAVYLISHLIYKFVCLFVFTQSVMFKKKDPRDQVKEWKQSLRKESNSMDRQIRGIQREEQKVTKQIKDAAKKGSMDAAKILAKEMVQSHRAVNKLYASKAQLNSVSMQMDHQLG